MGFGHITGVIFISIYCALYTCNTSYFPAIDEGVSRHFGHINGRKIAAWKASHKFYFDCFRFEIFRGNCGLHVAAIYKNTKKKKKKKKKVEEKKKKKKKKKKKS